MMPVPVWARVASCAEEDDEEEEEEEEEEEDDDDDDDPACPPLDVRLLPAVLPSANLP